MRVALVHYWLTGMRGGEKVLEALCDLFPDADIFTHVVDLEALSPKLRQRTIRTTFINRLPGARRFYKSYLPLMPFALENLDLTDYDLVVSSESGPAKGVITRPGATHVCYCHTPMRYLWDEYHSYRRTAGFVQRGLMTLLAPPLRMWDVLSANRVDHFAANSEFVAQRIRRTYRREATVIYPPVDTQRWQVTDTPKDYFLCFGQLVPYKRIDIAVEAFRRNGLRLVIAGAGEGRKTLEARATPNISFVGRQSDEELADLLQNCRALIFPGQEDFGIVPVEVMACGRPVIAYASGGALETVIDGETGVHFHSQTPEALQVAVETFVAREHAFDPAAIRRHAEKFSPATFNERFSAFLAETTGLCVPAVAGG